jgi:NTE family protein
MIGTFIIWSRDISMEPKVCLALGGGAARGLAHLGVLKVFEDAKLPVHMIAGTSLGSLMGGLYASRPDASYWIERVDQYLRSFRSRKTRLELLRRMEQPDHRQGFFADMANLVRKGYFWGVTATKPAFISEEEYEDFLNPLIPDIRIEEAMIPFGCVATDICNGKRVVYTAGSLRTAVRASCALPGIFPPVRDSGMQLVDGGWVERVPVICARDMGADVVIAVDVSSEIPRFDGSSGLDIVLRADAVTRVFLNELLLDEADVKLHPKVGNVHWADFSNPRGLVRHGELEALAKIVAIRSAIIRAEVPPRTLVDQIRLLKDKIMEKMAGKQ